MKNSVVIIGNGLAALQAAIELADLGVRICIISKDNSLGGNAKNLYKAFPTNDCFYCISSSKERCGIRKCFYRSGVWEHPNIKIFLDSEIKSVEGEINNFKLNIIQKPQYINHFKCIQCGECEKICPILIETDEELGFKNRKAIFHRLQNIPYSYFMNREYCELGCKKCEEICPTKAINLTEMPKSHEIMADVIIIGSSYSEFDPTELKEYHFKDYPNVITQIQLARMLDPIGPTDGKILRLSDLKQAKNILMLQCVGSRDEKTNNYCSGICCTFACKHAKIIKEERISEARITIVYKDIRTEGFLESYYRDCRELGIDFLKGHVSDIKLQDEKIQLTVFDMILNRHIEFQVDLLVLSAGIIPSDYSKSIMKKLHVQIKNNGFPITNSDLIETSRKGIFICGSAIKPISIPESINLAKAAAFKTIQTLWSEY
ncbi:MAG: FAD-dependent oxidoreductase [Candidatus Helarchaeota archaeon]